VSALTLKLGILGAGVLAAALLVMQSACNTGFADCPAKEDVKPDDSCKDDNLQCPYDLTGPATACDGTQATIETSCTCDKGHWSCPDPVECDGGGGGEDEAGSTDEGGLADEAGSTNEGGSGGEAGSTDAGPG
jgi:hypothetical protein